MDPIAVILVAAGVVFLFAALVGGKLKLWKFVDVDVKSSRSKIAQIVSGCLGIVLLIVGIGVHGGVLEYLQIADRRVFTTSGIVVEPNEEFTNVRFVDDFTSKKLSSKWRIIEPDNQRWAIQPNRSSILIVTQKGSIWGTAKNLRNQFILEWELPQEDFEVIVKVLFQIQNQHNSVSVALFQDDDNFLGIGYFGQEWGYNVRRVPYFSKELRGNVNNLFGEARGFGKSESPETFFLRIERIGNQYSGYYAFLEARLPEKIDDIRWVKIGTHAWINSQCKLSFWADNSNDGVYGGGNPPEVAAEFDLVLIRAK